MSLNAAPTLDITNATLWPNPTNAATNYRNQSTNQLNTITNYITSNIVNKLNATTNGGGAAEIGCTNVATGSGNTIYANLQFTYAAAVNAVAGSITNDTLTEAMMAAEMKKATNGVAPYNTMAAMQNAYIAGGTATALTVNTGYFTGVNNQMFTFIAASNNSAANTTIAADSVNAAPVYKANTTNAPTFVVGKAYSVWYNATNVCFFVKASAEGTAVAANVLAGTTFSNDNDTGLSGTMVDRSGETAASNYTMSGTTIKLLASEGYRDGVNDYVTKDLTAVDADLTAANIKNGVNILGITGTYPSITAGTNNIVDLTDTVQTTDTSYVKKRDYDMVMAGTYRVTFYLATNNASGAAYGRIYVNDVAVGTERSTTSLTGVSFIEDFTVSVGDNIQLYIHGSSGYNCANSIFKIGVADGIFYTKVL